MMESCLIYIGKAALAAGAFYLVFLALFQNQKQFTFNRIYLPVSLALSFAIPLITFTTVNYVEPIPVESNLPTVFTESFEPVVLQQSQPQFMWEWHHYLFAVYAAGTAIFLFRLLLGHVKAWNIIRHSRLQELFNSLVNISKKDIHPFSFFNKIVLSEDTLSHPNLKIIVEHEKIHVKEKHALDILFTEILFLLQWFNPFVWLLKDAIKNNLEYKTDHEIAKTINAQIYQMAMLTLADKQGVAPFLTALNGSQLKSRIIMMKKKNRSKYSWLKQLMVLPLLTLLVMGLANKEVKTEYIQQETVIGKINWLNNEKYSSAELTNVLGVKEGDKYSKEIIEKRVYGEVSNLYMDNGYLFFNIKIAEKQKNDNTVDLEFTIFEGTQWKIGKIGIYGNKNISDEEYLNKIEIRPGDLFSRRKLIQSVESLNEMINSDTEIIDVEVNPDLVSQNYEFNTVHLEFKIAQK